MSAAPRPAGPFAGSDGWVRAPSVWGGGAGAVLAVVYGMLTFEIPVETRWVFAGIGMAFLVVGTLLGDRVEAAGLASLKRLGQLPGAPGPAERPVLLEATRELFRFPRHSFRVNAVAWALCGTGVALCCTLVSGVSGRTALRIFFVGLGFGPLSAIAVYLLVQQRSRVVLRRLAEHGLTVSDAVRLHPPREDQALRRRLVVFMSVAVLTPTLLVLDVQISFADNVLETLLATPPHAQGAMVAKVPFLARGEVLLSVLIILFSLYTAYVGGQTLADPLRELTLEAERLASGRLWPGRPVPSEDETWAAAAAFAGLQAELSAALSRLTSAGGRIGRTTSDLREATESQLSGGNEQAASLTETSATTEELSRSASQIADNAGHVATIADRTVSAAEAGQRGSTDFLASMANVRGANGQIADAVMRLNKRVQQIGRIVEFIHGVGDKADLLALNAELEGTKAGEVGRGFSLVASEMRRLAENVVRSTHEIERLISEIRDGTNAAVMATESGLKAMDEAATRANQVQERLLEIVSMARLTSEAVRSISQATLQQQSGTQQLAQAMDEILRITEDGGSATSSMSQASDALVQLARGLESAVSRFQLTDGAAHGAPPPPPAQGPQAAGTEVALG